MSALWTDITAAMATNGKAVDMWDVYGISIDTRSLRPGDLFVPIKDIRDGHDFIPMAYEKGAAAVISEREIEGVPALIVKDSMGALNGLAIAARTRSDARRIAVTGSVGKTSVKEMLAVIFRSAGSTHASIKSFNNHWGVPLTLASMPHNTKFGVFEMGMNHKGELLELSRVVRPDIAIITKISGAHLEYFGSISEIAKAKAEILSGVEKGGVALLPRDSQYYGFLADAAKKYGIKTKSFGSHIEADARILSAQLSRSSSVITLDVMGQQIKFALPLPGKHWVENAACSLLCAKLTGLDLGASIDALQKMKKLKGRGEIIPLQVNGIDFTLIDESYNANPESMRAAIGLLGLNSGRKIAVLGDMLELGGDELALHAGLAKTLQKSGIEQVLCCGQRMKALEENLPKTMKAGWYENANACLSGLKKILQNGDTVMVKGSNASGMGKLVMKLIKNNVNEGMKNVL